MDIYILSQLVYTVIYKIGIYCMVLHWNIFREKVNKWKLEDPFTALCCSAWNNYFDSYKKEFNFVRSFYLKRKKNVKILHYLVSYWFTLMYKLKIKQKHK